VNQVALVTGGSRGIGRGIALALARAGFDVAINYARNQAAAEEAAAVALAGAAASGHRIRAVIVRADVAAPEDRELLLAFAKETFGRLDVLVNNAGVAVETRADLLDTSESSFDRLIEINLKAPFFLTQLAAKWMIEQVEADQQRRPKIIAISSISAYTASINRGEYCVSKAALAMVTGLFATRLAAHGIGVFEIRPGIIATDMTAPVKEKYDQLIEDGLTPIQRWGTPEDVGKAVTAIALGYLPFSTGEVINVDGGFHLRRL
jgi:3-oxoacyl-[acyl-carrier protein] reductase